MSELTKLPPEFGPKIPLWMQPHYAAMPPHEKWKCDMASVQEQQNNWLMDHAVRADEHRTHINSRVDALAEEVKPMVALGKRFVSVKAKCIAVFVLILVPVIVSVASTWLNKLMH